jgi:hypothetical protein
LANHHILHAHPGRGHGNHSANIGYITFKLLVHFSTSIIGGGEFSIFLNGDFRIDTDKRDKPKDVREQDSRDLEERTHAPIMP